MKMRKFFKRIRLLGMFRKCRYCGYSGSNWPDSGECPSCGEIN